MTCMNLNYTKVKESYLFADIRRRIDAWLLEHPGKTILRLGIGDVTQPLTPAVIRAMHQAVEDQAHPESFHGYMPECGDPQLRSAIARWYQKRSIPVAADEVFVSSGASDELGDILHLFDRSLPAMIPEPAYPAYADASIMDGREIIFPDTVQENGFQPVPPEKEITALIYLCSPDNPTGAVCTRECLKQWVEYACRTDSVILFDAAYESFVCEDGIPRSIYEIKDAKRCAVEISSLSKTAGFTGTRCGYTVIPMDLIRDSMSLNAMWVRNRTTRTNGVSYILQKGALAVFSEEGQKEIQELHEVYRRNAQAFMKALDDAGLSYTGGKNSPYIWMKCPQGMDSWGTFDVLLKQAQIAATPGAGFGRSGEGWIRFSMFASDEDIREAGRRIVTLKNENYF
ncbi:MAG: LL-diaminopimelate aminotransferase [Solobacterium sp.]|nr:LL-diaminopimelate aminotransferase [Solobacterium sp.]